MSALWRLKSVISSLVSRSSNALLADRDAAKPMHNSMEGIVHTDHRGTAPLERLREPRLQELSQLRCGLELRDRIQFIEHRGESV